MAAVKSLLLAGALLALTAAKHPPAAAPAPEPAPAVAPTIKAGVEKWRAGDYAAAVAIWQPFAAAGDADALFNLGQAYKLGRGVDADPAMARDYYRKAAVKGHLPAQANLGIALFQAGEKPEAIKWLKTAADRGEARAQYVLGIAAFNGDGIPRSQSLGYGYLLRAQASGLPQAATALGMIAPGLSPADRSAGEAIAASLAAGSGVPAALATTTPRLIPGAPPSRATASLPIVTPPRAAVASPAAPAPTGTPPAAVATATAASKPASGPMVADQPALPPVPRPAPAVPLREPTPAQADTAARVAARDEVAPGAATAPAPRPAGTTTIASGVASRPGPTPAVTAVAIPASHPAAPDPLAPRPVKVTPPEVAHAEWPPSAAPPPKPFQTDAPAKKPDGWRVQLGAFSSRKLADAAWADVKAAAAPAKPLFAVDGSVTKLQMGPFATRDAAKAACTKLTAAGRACFVTQG